MTTRAWQARAVALAAAVLSLIALQGCYGPRGVASTPEERRINTGADASTVKGKQAGALMDSKLIPAPGGVKTGTQGGQK